ncbi:hypothetical protein [Jiangella muralis]|uniref:hypothetical protein n=1 Tax=Jiangella muralis TaxID=702383 RepID=UPI0012F710EF|nr:hypothetical protein [Jiangella muralis]
MNTSIPDIQPHPRAAMACADCGRVSLFSWWWTERDGLQVQVCFDCLTAVTR